MIIAGYGIGIPIPVYLIYLKMSSYLCSINVLLGNFIDF